VERFGEVWSHPVRQEFAKVRRGRDVCGMFRQSRMGLFRCDAERYVVVWQSRSGEVSFGEVWLGRFALERIGLDRQVRDRNGKAVRDRTGCVRSGRTRQSRTGSVRSNKARFGMAVRDGTGWNRCAYERGGGMKAMWIAFTTVPATVLIFVTMKKLNIRSTMTQSMTGCVFGSGAQNVSHVEKIIN
jgi:hypothetical protein